MKTTFHFVGIAIQEYTDFPTLEESLNEIQSFQELLEKRYDLGEDSSYSILFDQTASKAHILGFLEELTRSTEPTDQVIIYYSGHSDFDQKSNMTYWIPNDGKSDQPDTWISSQSVTSYLAKIPAKHIALISNAAFAAPIMDFKQEKKSSYKKLSKLNSRWLLSSGRILEGHGQEGLPNEGDAFAAALSGELSSHLEKRLGFREIAEDTASHINLMTNQIPLYGPLEGTGHEGGELFLELQASFLPKVTPEPQTDHWQEIIQHLDLSQLPRTFINKFPEKDFTIKNQPFKNFDLPLPDTQQNLLSLQRENFSFKLCRKTADFKEFLRLYPKGVNKEKAENRVNINIGSIIAECFTQLGNANYPRVYNELLKDLIETEAGKAYRMEAVMFSGRWKSLQQRQLLGGISLQEYSIMLNDLNMGLMSFFQGIE
jgi:hypothetical protein